MAEAFGSKPGELIAGIGPSIGPCCYEVGDEVAAAVRASFARAEKLLPRNGNQRRHFDLWSANRRWLEEAGVRQIEVAEVCTACHVDEFFSYRGGKGRTGHFGALMALRARRG
jgi:copper oxidase (laccase) domain-containing protein